MRNSSTRIGMGRTFLTNQNQIGLIHRSSFCFDQPWELLNATHVRIKKKNELSMRYFSSLKTRNLCFVDKTLTHLVLKKLHTWTRMGKSDVSLFSKKIHFFFTLNVNLLFSYLADTSFFPSKNTIGGFLLKTAKKSFFSPTKRMFYESVS